jgi:hypothetical protein
MKAITIAKSIGFDIPNLIKAVVNATTTGLLCTIALAEE